MSAVVARELQIHFLKQQKTTSRFSKASSKFVFSPGDLKGLSLEIFRAIFWLAWIYLGLNGHRFWFFNFQEDPLILDSKLKYRWVLYLTFSEIKELTIESAVLQFSFFWVSGPPRNAAKGVNTSRRLVESPRMIDNYFRSSPRMFFTT